MTTLNQAVRTLTQREATQAALRNEQLTRQRVETLERQSKNLHERLTRREQELTALKASLWGRLRWLLTGN